MSFYPCLCTLVFECFTNQYHLHVILQFHPLSGHVVPIFVWNIQALCCVGLVSSGCPIRMVSHTHTHNHFTALFPGLPGWAGAVRNLLDFMVQREMSEADTLTIQLGIIPSGLISDSPPSSPIFCARCPSCGNPPNLSWLGTGTKYIGLHTKWLVSTVIKMRPIFKSSPRVLSVN